MPWGSFEILEKQFSVNDDKPLVSVIDEAKTFLIKINPIEVFFSARFFFYKQGSAENVFTKIPQGIKAMSGFLEEFYKQIPNRSQTTEELLNLIIKHPVIRIPQDMLLVYALVNILLCAIVAVCGGWIGLYAMLGISFFMSIMYPTQFSLALKDLGSQTKSGSAFLVMSIVGNACLPQFTAYLMHVNEQMYHLAYVVPMVCFLFCAYYGWRGYKVLD